MGLRSTLAALAVFGSSAAAQSPAAEQRDWQATTAADARAFHDELQHSHPGLIDPANPGFQALLDSGSENARQLVEIVRQLEAAGPDLRNAPLVVLDVGPHRRAS